MAYLLDMTSLSLLIDQLGHERVLAPTVDVNFGTC